MIKAFLDAVARDLPYAVILRKKGDAQDPREVQTRADEGLGWKAELKLEQACGDIWKW